MEEKLKSKYPWLFVKKYFRIETGKKKWFRKEITPIIEDHDSHWRVYKEKDASPLILSKNF